MWPKVKNFDFRRGDFKRNFVKFKGRKSSISIKF